MIWQLIKIFLFLGLAIALAFGLSIVLETPGEIAIAVAGREWFLSPMGAIIALVVFLLAAWLLLKIAGLLLATFRFLLGDETAISRYFGRNREKRGYDALSDGMIALASGDAKLAQKKATKADKLLNRPELTGLLAAQSAELAGDRKKATAQYKALLENDRTRFVGIKGLMQQQLEEGDTEKALALAKKAFAIQPGNPALLTQLFELQSREEDWSGARETLNASMHTRLLPRDVGNRRDAVLSLADARAAQAAGNTARRNDAALQAIKLAPTLVPAAAMAAHVHAEAGSKRKANKVLTKAWSVNPHPDLAAAFAAIVPDETPEQRRKRFEVLIAANPNHIESKLLRTELALTAEDFPAARKALGDLAETEPTTRSLSLMAAIERGEGSPEAVVRGWLAKALEASRGPQWVCSKCNQVHADWTPVCDACGAFDTLTWKTPENEVISDQSAALPLILGPLQTEGIEEAAEEDDTTEDAETAAPADEDDTTTVEAPPRPDGDGARMTNA